MRKRDAVAVIGLVLSLAGSGACARPGGEPEPADALRASLAALGSARSVHMAGHVSLSGTTYRLALSVDHQQRAQGSVLQDQSGVDVTYIGGKLYAQGPAYFKRQGIAFGDRWIIANNDRLGPLVAKLADRAALTRALVEAAGTDVGRQAGPTVDGARSVKLTSANVSVTVPSHDSAAPTRVVVSPDITLSNGLADMVLDLSEYGRPISVAAPTTSLDLGDIDTFPPAFAAVVEPHDTFAFESCDDRGCTLAVTLRNDGGKAGTASATFSVKHVDTVLSTCVASVPQVRHGETARVGCRINWDRYLADTSGAYRIDNPA